MMAFRLLILAFSIAILQRLPSTSASIHRAKLLSEEHITEHSTYSGHASLTTYFEVTKPIKLPTTKPYSYLLLQQDFASTYGKSPFVVDYNPPSVFKSQKLAKIVLEWKATSKGRQFDRIFGVWLGGVELLRSCTAEPRATGTVWTVKKDITKYHSLLKTNQKLAVYMGNIVDSIYTGVYHVNLSIHFYPAEANHDSHKSNSGNGVGWHRTRADLILPISRNLPLNDGLWFEIENSNQVESKQFKIPQNTYRAVLEVYVSPHENDEFWYTNVPADYLLTSNVTGFAGNGAFREVVVSLDGVVAGAVWPFTVIYTGGLNPLLWRPVTGIRSFDLPSYDIELTPFLGNLLDGKIHELSFRVTNALNVWYVDANLHLWLDRKSVKTTGQLFWHNIPPLTVSLASNFTGKNGNFVTSARRTIHSSGWVKSSFGKITTDATQAFSFSNSMIIGKDSNLQIVNQSIDFNDLVYAEKAGSPRHMIKSFKRFPLYFSYDSVDNEDESSSFLTNLELGFEEDRAKTIGTKVRSSSLIDLQNGHGDMVVKGNLVVRGEGKTQQVYRFRGSEYCYYRDVAGSNYTVLHDEVVSDCSKIW